MSDAAGAEAAARFAGFRVLVVEDEFLIALMIEDMLTELGCAQVWQAGGVGDALAILRVRRPDAAVLDVNLAGEPAYPVAEQLDARTIPFIFTTGYGRQGMPDLWARRPIIQKPFTAEDLRAVLESVLGA
jgi:CheY-like chemotaxis protein